MHSFLTLITPIRGGINDIYPELDLTKRAREIVKPPVEHTGLLRILNGRERRKYTLAVELVESDLFHEAIDAAIAQCKADRAEYIYNRDKRRDP